MQWQDRLKHVDDKEMDVFLSKLFALHKRKRATQLHTYPIKVEKHRTLNSSKGVVHSDIFDGMTEDEIVGYLSAQKSIES